MLLTLGLIPIFGAFLWVKPLAWLTTPSYLWRNWEIISGNPQHVRKLCKIHVKDAPYFTITGVLSASHDQHTTPFLPPIHLAQPRLSPAMPWSANVSFQESCGRLPAKGLRGAVGSCEVRDGNCNQPGNYIRNCYESCNDTTVLTINLTNNEISSSEFFIRSTREIARSEWSAPSWAGWIGLPGSWHCDQLLVTWHQRNEREGARPRRWATVWTMMSFPSIASLVTTIYHHLWSYLVYSIYIYIYHSQLFTKSNDRV